MLSVHTYVMGCGWTIYSNVFCMMMKYFPVTKNPPVSASAAEAAANFKILQFTFIGPFMRSRAHFEGKIPEGKYPSAELSDSGSVIYDTSVSGCKIMSEA